jgi:hypothetical protein
VIAVAAVAALVVGTVAAIAVSQRYRSEGTVISAVSTRPDQCPGREHAAEVPISFYLNRDDVVDLEIIDAKDRDLRRTLERDLALEGNRRHCVGWNGRDEEGKRLPPGAYRLRISLQDADRVAIAGELIRLARGDASP